MEEDLPTKLHLQSSLIDNAILVRVRAIELPSHLTKEKLQDRQN